MKKSNCYKPFTIQPVAGPLDLTSSPDEVPFGGYRWSENFECNPQDKKLSRAPGYEKFLSSTDYNNPDLHDQLLGLTDGAVRQHLTFGFEARTPVGFTKLFVGTQNRLFSKNNKTQNWSVIWDGFGGEPNVNGVSEIILQAANVNTTVLFSNDFDDPVYHVIDQPPNTDGQSVQKVPDFQTLNITRVGFLIAWNNLVIAANVVMDGVRQTNAVLWSDYKRPISFVPGSNSLAGRKFLDYGEVVLAAAPMADALLMYTNRGIWEVRVSDAVDADQTPQVLSFSKRYTPDRAGSRCLKYKRTLITTGDEHYYAGQDGIYSYSFYTPRPEIEEWSRRAASWLFIEDQINSSLCAVHCAGYEAKKKQIRFSYARQGESVPSETLVMNTVTHFSSIIREGATFFLNHDPKILQSLKDFIYARCICTPSELEALVTPKEGGVCVPDVVPECLTRPARYISATPYTIFGITTEDWRVALPDADSLRFLLSGVTFADTCGAEYTSEECSAGTLFIFASAVDRCIKQATNVFYRERCTGFDACGTYSRLGYKSILRSGPINLRAPSENKTWGRFAIEVDAAVAVVPGRMQLRIGVAGTALDPNVAKCPIYWEEIMDSETGQAFKLKCLASVSSAMIGIVKDDAEMEWPLHHAGHNHYFELTIDNPDSTPVDVGAAASISRITIDAKLEAEGCLG